MCDVNVLKGRKPSKHSQLVIMHKIGLIMKGFMARYRLDATVTEGFFHMLRSIDVLFRATFYEGRGDGCP
jgi:hypothetical protein